MIDVLSSEWLKLRSTRSTYSVLGAIGAMVVGAAVLTMVGVQGWDSITEEQRANPNFSATPMEQVLLPLVHVCAAVLGVLAITAEYSTGMIRTSMTVVPRRRVLLAAKAPVVGGATLVAGLAYMFLAFAVVRMIVGDRAIPGHTAPLSQESGLLLASGLSVAVVGVFGLGLGAAIRSTAGAMVTVVAFVFVLPGLTRFLPAPWDDRVSAVLLPNLSGQLAGTGEHTVLSPVGALVVMACYVVVPLVIASVLVGRRDV
jgi:ABC-2 type transport system permease protein